MTWDWFLRWLPAPASQHAASLDEVMIAIHAHMLVQAAAWGALFVVALWRFRQSRHPRARYESLRGWLPALAILAVIVGDAAILVSAALPAWRARMTPPEDAAPIEVRVIGEQFVWNVHYPGPDGRFGRTLDRLISATNPLGIDRTDPDGADDLGLLNILRVPVDRSVLVHLSSRDVVHGFSLPEMRVKLDATPGMLTRTWFTPVRTGTWDIGCAQLCGLGHYRMRGELTVMAPEDWARWIAEEARAATAGGPTGRPSPAARPDGRPARARGL